MTRNKGVQGSGMRIPKSRLANMRSDAHRRSRKQEQELADRIGGDTTPASGAKHIKGDVRLQRVVRLECKTTTKKSFSVTREMLDKIQNAACGAGEIPAFVVEFLDGTRSAGEFVVLPSYALDYLVDGIKNS